MMGLLWSECNACILVCKLYKWETSIQMQRLKATVLFLIDTE